MDCISLSDIPKDPYYKGRADYLLEVARIVRTIPDCRVLELGPHLMSIVKGCDTTDERQWDARKIPWPIGKREYGLFIALQVWEHLEGRQLAAFREVMRIADKAILSFPYKWTRSKLQGHNGITRPIISAWTGGVDPVLSVRVGNPHNEFERVIYYWDFARQ